MSSNDVRDILSLSNGAPGVGTKASRASRAPPTLSNDVRPKARPEGMSRELYALLGPNAPSLVMANGAPLDGGDYHDYASIQGAFQPKFVRKPNTAAARKWVWSPFRNQARNDTQARADAAGDTAGDMLGSGSVAHQGLVLHHWQPYARVENAALDEVYMEESWLPFNTTSHVFHYSTEEYNQYLHDDDWTREETDYLIYMCEEYDTRFIVIEDRYEWPDKKRTIEDLKSRYYTIARRLIRERISNEDIETRQAQLQTYAYDKQQETDRKRAVEKLFLRTPDQFAEEEALYVEARRLEQNEAKFAKERNDLLRLLGGWESLPNANMNTVAAVGAGLTAFPPSDTEADGGKKRRKLDSAPPSAKVSGDPKQALFDAQNFITRFATDAPHVLRTPYPNLIGTPSVLPSVATHAQGTKAESHAHHGAYLRSTRMLGFRPNQYARAMQALAELDPPIGPRLVFPTASNVEKWETLMGAVAGSLEMKKQLERVEAEHRIAHARLVALVSLAASGAEPPAATSEMSEQMHVDEPVPEST
ncbi:swr complex subunit [Malassezia vespertilionis]|uniref:SWR1-complex protein 4 n=1 Tax=Malassezia vespertilionis TaxID=2020962 RepID=A0A2N1JEM2_9BASI|nr:swr complex subunit [Malassezia vespertilionis]PKI84997.1 Swc4p [Malassezia vespertilionis]WFD05745.1 swr complex subunit [Malassezia vespertilionis]